MPPRSRREAVEDQLAHLRDLRGDASSPDALEDLRKALQSKSARVAGRAAQIAGEAGLGQLIPDLETAFHRFMSDPIKADPGCLAKLPLVRALSALNAVTDEVFLAAARHRQPEPAFGGPIDSAVELRSVAVVALAEASHPKALEEGVQLLADEEPRARMGAITAFASAASRPAALVLRLKALVGDAESRVTEECLKALLDIELESLPFVAPFLSSPSPTIAKAAALAIGEARPRGALAVLRKGLEDSDDDGVRETIIVSIAMLRDQDGVEFLAGVIEEGITADALRVLTALSIYGRDEQLRQRVEKAARQHTNPHVLAAFWELFPRMGN